MSITATAARRALAAFAAIALCGLMLLPGCSSPSSSEGSQGPQAGTQPEVGGTAVEAPTVTVSVKVPEGVDAQVGQVKVAISEESTVYDALVTTGWPFETDSSNGTLFITSIGGVSNGSLGAQSGWVYTVNGESVMEACDKCPVQGDDVIEWEFIS